VQQIELQKCQTCRTQIPECDGRQSDPLGAGNVVFAQTQSHLDRDQALNHVSHHCNRPGCVVDAKEGGFCPAGGFNCRIPVALDGSAFCEDADDAENAKNDLQDAAEVHRPTESSMGLDVVEQPCPVV